MNNTDTTISREVEAARLFVKISHMHRRAVERRVSEFGVPRSQHRLLMHIERMREVPSQSELAKQLDVSGATVAVMLKKLESAGYIEKTVSSCDCRNNEIKITEAGLELVRRSRRSFSEVDEEFFGALSEDELCQFTEYMKRIAQRASASESGKITDSGKE